MTALGLDGIAARNRHRNRHRNWRGMTVVEILIVVSLLGLVASIGFSRLGAAGAKAQHDTVVAKVRDLDARARVLARTGVPLKLVLEDDARLLAVRRIDVEYGSDAEDVPLYVIVPDGHDIAIRQRSVTTMMAGITIDSLGQSDDYEVVITSPSVTRTLEVHGLTGWITDEQSGGTR